MGMPSRSQYRYFRTRPRERTSHRLRRVLSTKYDVVCAGAGKGEKVRGIASREVRDERDLRSDRVQPGNERRARRARAVERLGEEDCDHGGTMQHRGLEVGERIDELERDQSVRSIDESCAVEPADDERHHSRKRCTRGERPSYGRQSAPDGETMLSR